MCLTMTGREMGIEEGHAPRGDRLKTNEVLEPPAGPIATCPSRPALSTLIYIGGGVWYDRNPIISYPRLGWGG